nr:beta-ketoacyl synthase N-terminal-like domain-containing protein [Acidobacteriota bacterium]
MSKLDELQSWLQQRICTELGLEPDHFDIRVPFNEYGLDSVDVVSISGELESMLNCRLSPTVLYEYPTVAALSAYLADLAEGRATGAPASESAGRTDAVAIVGIGCRFPGAHGPEVFWDMLCRGTDAVSEVPADRWKAADYYDPRGISPGKAITRWAGFLDDVKGFDNHFFGISPAEAERMDPQQRLLLETSWECLADAGLPAENLAGSRTGVYVGISTNEYSDFQLSDANKVDGYTASGSAYSIAANRLSYFFDFHGPSIAVDTACSSSLVSVDMACRALRDGSCELALAGGVNLILSPAGAIGFSKAGAMADDGRCKTFDARANGYVRGEGVGMVALKPLKQAQADGDRIYAVIRGTAVGQDGRTNGLMAPSPRSQEAVIRRACDKAGVSPKEVRFVEAHGTGTLLGDPIEAKGLGAVYGAEREEPLLVGSVKTNIGHLESGAGVAALIKTALSLTHGELPPSLHYETPNPHIDFEDLKLRVNTERAGLGDGPVIAGISSFGFGGTLAHAILETGPESPETDEEPIPSTLVLPLSAGGKTALRNRAEQFRDLLAEARFQDRNACYALCRSAALRGSHLDQRLVVSGPDAASLREALIHFLEDRAGNDWTAGSARQVKPELVFSFGNPDPETETFHIPFIGEEQVGARVLRECNRQLTRRLGKSFLDGDAQDADTRRLRGFAVQLAAIAQLESWGVEAQTFVGEGLGRIAAARAAGCLTLGDAITIALSLVLGDDVPETIRPREADGKLVLDGEEATTPDRAYWLKTSHKTEWEKPGAFLISIGSSGQSAATVIELNHAEPGLYHALGKLFCTGFSIAWEKLYHTPAPMQSLPRYPWNHKALWLGPEGVPAYAGRRGPVQSGGPEHPLLGFHTELAAPRDAHVWQARVDVNDQVWLRDHVVGGRAVFPGAAYLEMAVSALGQAGLAGSHDITGVELHDMLELNRPMTVQVSLAPGEGSTHHLTIYGRPASGGDWTSLATLKLERDPMSGMMPHFWSAPKLIQKQLEETMPAGDFYSMLQAAGFHYGPDFQGVADIHRKDGEALGRIELPETLVT